MKKTYFITILIFQISVFAQGTMQVVGKNLTTKLDKILLCEALTIH